MLVVIRHARKEYNNRSYRKQRYDAPIVEDEWSRSKVVFSKYIADYSLKPTRIITSPYLRTRQTAQILTDMTGIKYEVDQHFSNFISIDKTCYRDDFAQSTLKYEPVCRENVNSFTNRVTHRIEDLYKNLKKGEVVWVITHRYAIFRYLRSQNIVELDNLELPDISGSCYESGSSEGSEEYSYKGKYKKREQRLKPLSGIVIREKTHKININLLR
jgi:broad specificity phosphatase PhoE